MPERKPAVLAIVPARAGSKGVPRKNLLELGGRTLVWHAVRSGVCSRHVTRTICTTEDDELAREAMAAGADVPFQRPSELASDTAGSWAVVCHAVATLETQGWSPDFVVLLQPPTPFRTAAHVDAVLDAVFESGASSGLTIRPSDYPPHWMFWRQRDGRLMRLFADGAAIRRRQDAPVAWQPNGLVYVVRRSVLRPDLALPLDDTIGVPMEWEESVNIDSLWQFRLAEMLWTARDGESRRGE
jgi:CMP-N-acetylneuraminic acid synthetase